MEHDGYFIPNQTTFEPDEELKNKLVRNVLLHVLCR